MPGSVTCICSMRDVYKLVGQKTTLAEGLASATYVSCKAMAVGSTYLFKDRFRFNSAEAGSEALRKLEDHKSFKGPPGFCKAKMRLTYIIECLVVSASMQALGSSKAAHESSEALIIQNSLEFTESFCWSISESIQVPHLACLDPPLGEGMILRPPEEGRPVLRWALLCSCRGGGMSWLTSACGSAAWLRASLSRVTNLSSVTSSRNLKCWSLVIFRILRRSVKSFSLSCRQA